MTNAELITTIRNEIERRMRAYDESIEKYADKKKSMKAERDAWRWAECKSLLSFLSTLEKSEKPINQSGSSEIPNDLEEAAKEWSKENTRGFVLKDKTTRYVGDTIDAFIAGAKWQAANTPLPEDTVLFNKGVEEGKRLMMEEAVECELVCIKDRLAAILPMKEFQWTIGDKVRIIVIPKEDEK